MSIQSNALISFDEFKLYRDNYKSIAENDTLVENLINYVTDEFHTYCEIVQFKSRQYTEYYDGNNSNRLFPKRTPIISVTSIYNDVDWVYGVDKLITATNYKIVDNTYITFKEIICKADQNIKLVYTAGYVTIPGDIKLAALKEVARAFDRRFEADITGKSLNDGSVQYTEKGLLKETKDTLDKYRRLTVY
jgi:hypothetical protein